jgi:hypothetical protein
MPGKAGVPANFKAGSPSRRTLRFAHSTIQLEELSMKRLILTALCGLSLLAFSSTVKAQSPVPGQSYQVPDGYATYGAGTLISYGGYNYVIQANATMLLADQQGDSSPPADDPLAGQAYQIPDGYSGYAAGSVITYGGSSYVLQSNGTMLLSSQGTDLPQGGQVYQIPNGYSGYPAGTVIAYGGANYTLGLILLSPYVRN